MENRLEVSFIIFDSSKNRLLIDTAIGFQPPSRKTNHRLTYYLLVKFQRIKMQNRLEISFSRSFTISDPSKNGSLD